MQKAENPVINKVICVCCKKDAATFHIAATYICELIAAKTYVVLVPKIDYEYFMSLDLAQFTVVSEDRYQHIAAALHKKSLGNRFGWYFQQFIKMSELDEGADSDINLIWDADTVPLKELSLEHKGKISFYQGDEYHPPYFDLVRKLINEEKLVESSFIAQCLPYRVKWFREFKTKLEADNQTSWYQKIIDLINPAEESGFSEYETLGTYAAKNFSSEVSINENSKNWYRYGKSLIGHPQNIEKYKDILSRKYDFVSFESWDTKKVSRINRFLKLYFFKF